MCDRIKRKGIYLNECIEINASNAHGMKQLVKNLIEQERKDGFYDQANCYSFDFD